MANITNLGVPYPEDRNGLVTVTGPTTVSGAGSRELFDHNNIWIPATDLHDSHYYTGGCTVLMNYTSGAYVRVFPPDTYTESTYVFRRPRHWLGGKIVARIWYTSDADAAKFFFASINFATGTEGTTAFSGHRGYDYSALPPAATTGYLTISRYWEQAAGLVSEYPDTSMDAIMISFSRTGGDASDTSTKDLLLFGIEVMYIKPVSDTTVDLPDYMMKA